MGVQGRAGAPSKGLGDFQFRGSGARIESELIWRLAGGGLDYLEPTHQMQIAGFPRLFAFKWSAIVAYALSMALTKPGIN